MKVFPPMSLPGTAANWGRALETSLRGSERALEAGLSDFQSANRATSGQLARSSGTVTELLNRFTEVANLDPMEVSGNQTSAPFPSVSQSHTFQPTPGGRTGFLVFQSQTTADPLGGGGVNPATPIVVFVRSGGNLLMRIDPEVTVGPAINPSESSTTGYIRGFCRLDLPADGAVQVTVELARGSNPTSSTVYLLNPTLTLTRSGSL